MAATPVCRGQEDAEQDDDSSRGSPCGGAKCSHWSIGDHAEVGGSVRVLWPDLLRLGHDPWDWRGPSANPAVFQSFPHAGVVLPELVLKAAFGFGVTGFLLMAIAFGRLFRQAWRMPSRRQALWRVLNVQPRRDTEWPNGTREADLIAIGAFCGVVFFGSLLALLVWR
jgi:hypothetical protein